MQNIFSARVIEVRRAFLWYFDAKIYDAVLFMVAKNIYVTKILLTCSVFLSVFLLLKSDSVMPSLKNKPGNLFSWRGSI